MDQGFLVFVIVVLPILCACLGFTVHYVIKPMVESLLDAIHDLARLGGGAGGDSARVARLEAEVEVLRGELSRVRTESPVRGELDDGRGASG